MTEKLNFHEAFRSDDPAKPASKRRFGYLMAGAFAIVGLWPLTRSGHVHVWALIVAVMFFTSALFIPRLLAPLLWLWMQIGFLMHRITNPILLGLIFYGAFVPTGFIMRALGKRPLHLAYEPERKSYWIERVPGPAPSTMTKQF
jgi:hypothetical protein